LEKVFRHHSDGSQEEKKKKKKEHRKSTRAIDRWSKRRRSLITREECKRTCNKRTENKAKKFGKQQKIRNGGEGEKHRARRGVSRPLTEKDRRMKKGGKREPGRPPENREKEGPSASRNMKEGGKHFCDRGSSGADKIKKSSAVAPSRERRGVKKKKKKVSRERKGALGIPKEEEKGCQ